MWSILLEITMELGRPDARRAEKVKVPYSEKIALPHDMVIFPDGLFGETVIA